MAEARGEDLVYPEEGSGGQSAGEGAKQRLTPLEPSGSLLCGTPGPAGRGAGLSHPGTVRYWLWAVPVKGEGQPSR